MEWLVANGQNYIEWSLLSAQAYASFDESSERQWRLAWLVDMAKNHSLRVGVDATFTQTQEHGWRLWRTWMTMNMKHERVTSMQFGNT